MKAPAAESPANLRRQTAGPEGTKALGAGLSEEAIGLEEASKSVSESGIGESEVAAMAGQMGVFFLSFLSPQESAKKEEEKKKK